MNKKNEKAINEFTKWLDTIIEHYTCNDELDDYLSLAETHERYVHEGMVRAFRMVEEAAKEMGLND